MDFHWWLESYGLNYGVCGPLAETKESFLSYHGLWNYGQVEAEFHLQPYCQLAYNCSILACCQCCWILAYLKGFSNTDLKQRYQCTMMVRIVAFFKGFPILISSRDVTISWLLQHAYWDTNCLCKMGIGQRLAFYCLPFVGNIFRE